MKKSKYILGALGIAAAAKVFLRAHQNKLWQNSLENNENKFYEYYQLLNRWMIGRNEGKKPADFFHQEGIHKIAVYGMGELANRFAVELEDTDIQIMYGIDRDVCCTNSRIEEIYYPDDHLPVVDAVVITPFLSAEEIEKNLSEKWPYRFISLDKIIYSL